MNNLSMNFDKTYKIKNLIFQLKESYILNYKFKNLSSNFSKNDSKD